MFVVCMMVLLSIVSCQKTHGEELKSDCTEARVIEPNVWVTIDLNKATENNFETYECGSNAKKLLVTFQAKEVVLVPNCPDGYTFAAQIKNSGFLIALLHDSYGPSHEKYVTAKVCKQFGSMSVSGGVVGKDYVVVDARENKTNEVKFFCAPPQATSDQGDLHTQNQINNVMGLLLWP